MSCPIGYSMNDCPYINNREDCPHDYCSYDLKSAIEDEALLDQSDYEYNIVDNTKEVLCD